MVVNVPGLVPSRRECEAKPGRHPFVVGLLLALAAPVAADELRLDDGSLLKGRIVEVAQDRVVMETAFAGRLEIGRARVARMVTDSKRFVRLESSDRIAGRLTVAPDGRQQLADTAFGTISIDGRGIDGLWDLDAPLPATERVEQQYERKMADIREDHDDRVTELKTDYEARIQKLERRKQELEDPWSGKIAFGLEGADGNTDRFGVQGRAEVKRETDFDRLGLYADVDFQEEDGAETVNEVLMGASLERDFTPRWFTFGQADFETDKFENLDLRADLTAGLGYFFVRRPGLQFKGKAGLGYQFESFNDGTNNSEPLGIAGYDLRYDYNAWLHFFHDLTYFAALTDPGEDWRVVTHFGSEMPLGDGKTWKLQVKVRNQYDNLPAPDTEDTDTSYRLNLVYDWK